MRILTRGDGKKFDADKVKKGASAMSNETIKKLLEANKKEIEFFERVDKSGGELTHAMQKNLIEIEVERIGSAIAYTHQPEG